MYRNIIRTKVRKYCKENGIDNEDLGFLKFVNEIFYNENQSDEDSSVIEESIVDGQRDKQIDLIQIEDEEVVTIRIIQVKNTKGFESNVVILLKNGLDWIFNREIEEVEKLKNTSFRDRILEVRDLIFNKKKTIYIDVLYVTLGRKSDIAPNDEIIEEIRDIENKYKKVYENFRFELYGAKELSDYIDLQNDKTVNMNFNIIYDTNSPSIIENEYDNIKSLVCNIKAIDLIKIFKLQKSEYLFEQNVRKYLEDRSKVNKNIIDSASSSDSQYFWALNNGVTMICDNYKLRRVGGSAIVEMENLQIINGCQTSMALYAADKNGTLNDDTMLLLRVHQTNDNEIIEKIILATNNQNPINPRDLMSNTTEQIELQKYFFEIYSVVYQRKRNDFVDLNGNKVSKKTIVGNDKVGQPALACIKFLPHIALSAKGRVFTTHIDIFRKNKENIALSFFIHEKILELSKTDEIKNSPNKLSIIKFGRFHITYLIYKKYNSKASIEFNKKIKNNDIDLKSDVICAIEKIEKELKEDQKHNLLAYFKSKESTSKLEKISI